MAKLSQESTAYWYLMKFHSTDVEIQLLRNPLKNAAQPRNLPHSKR